jgi:glucan 1,3-beta-glucosidase
LQKYGIKAIIDIHALRGSQNGLDGSGDMGGYDWVSTLSKGGAARYSHWDRRSANWIGKYNITTGTYDYVNRSHVSHALQVVREVVSLHKNDPVVIGIEPGEWPY